MLALKTWISIITIVLTFISYIPYIVDIFKGKTKPHVFSWFVWGITTFLVYALQMSAGAGTGAWVTMFLGAICFFIFLLGLRNGNKNIKKVDIVFLLLAISALPLWLVADQPILSIILLCTIDMLGFFPTIRKSWNDPYSETLSLYAITTFRQILSFFALEEYSLVTYLFSVTWVFANALFSILLVWRRRRVKKTFSK